ncbi:MAG: hypothetical protein J6B37_01995 [Clostridia bacterium]|nr:hypothetical protein [Clostridia bacterium]
MTNTTKKVISIMLTIFMLITIAPLSAFAVEEYPEIKAGDTYTVTKEEYVKFVPTESGEFIIRSVSDVDPRVSIYNSDMSQFDVEDDSGYRENNLDFYFVYEYTAGETYYFKFYDHNGEYNYTVYLFAPCTEHTGGTQTCKGYQCEVCSEWYGEGTDEHIDEDENIFCDVCNEAICNEIKAGDTYTVTTEEYVKFVPTESGKFILRSVSDTDPKVSFYDSDMSPIAQIDDSDYREENYLDFYFEYEYTAGETYYFAFFDHQGAYNYTVFLKAPCTEHTGGTQTCKGYQCEVCGEWYGEASEHTDENENGLCDFCDAFLGNEIKVGTYTITKEEYVKFVPDVSGRFIISSVSDTDPMVTLYDCNMEELAQEDDSYYRENDYDFYSVYEYTAGETYYFKFFDHEGGYNYTVYLLAPCTEHTGGTQTCKGYKCDVCGEWYGEAGDHDLSTEQTCKGYYCDFCEGWYGEAGDHDLSTEQTCKGYQCEVCEEWFGEADENKHGWYFGECIYCGIEYPADLECEHYYSHENNYNCITCGAKCPHESIDNGVCTDCLYSLPFLLTTGEAVTYHGSFADALYYAEDGSVIKLLNDYGDYNNLEINKAITLDLNGMYWDQPSSGSFTINAPVHFTDSTGGGFLYYGLNINSPVTFSGGAYRYIRIDFETEDTLSDYLADGYDYFDLHTDEVLDLSSEKLVEYVAIKRSPFTGIKDDHFYKNDVMQKAYQLVEFDGDFYFIGDRHEIIKGRKAYLSEERINGLTYADGTPIAVGSYEFDENGKMIILNGVVGNNVYKNNIKLKAYQLVEVDGDFYFIGDRHEIIKGRKAYLSEERINGLTYADGTPIAVGSYEFDENGKMIMREGIVGNHIYKNNIMLKAYQLVEVDGDFYFIGDRHEIIKGGKAYLSEARINGLTYADGTPIAVGNYNFDENGKMVILNGVVGNRIYENNVMLKAYQLVEVDGEIYYIGDRHEIIKGRKAYVSEERINGLTYADGTPITAGYYEFDENGKMIIE